MRKFLGMIVLGLSVSSCALVDSTEIVGELNLRFLNQSSATPTPDFRFTIDGLSSVRQLTVGDFEQIGPARYDAGPFETGTIGLLNVACSITTSSSPGLATVEADLQLRPDQRFDIDCSIGNTNPIGRCFGCTGSKSTSISSSDSLFLVWSASWISHPVTF